MRENLEKILYDLISKKFEIPVIFAYPNAPRPCKPYIVINYIAGTSPIGFDEVIYKDSDDFTIKGQRTLTYSINFIGEDSRNRADNFLNYLRMPTTLEVFQKNNISYIKNSGVTDISAELETGFEERANIDIDFNIATDIVDKIGYIADVEGEGKLKNGNEFSISI